jgi:hypothetical protein
VRYFLDGLSVGSEYAQIILSISAEMVVQCVSNDFAAHPVFPVLSPEHDAVALKIFLFFWRAERQIMLFAHDHFFREQSRHPARRERRPHPTRDWLGSCAELDHECWPQLLAFREGGAISWSNARRKLCGANGGPCRAEPSADIAANRTRIGTTKPTRAGRSGGGASDAARSFENRKLVTKREDLRLQGSTVRIVETSKVKKATKRELIVVATMISRMMGTPVFSDRTEYSVTASSSKALRFA